MGEHDDWLGAEMTLATDEVIEGRYGRIRFEFQALQGFASQLNSLQRHLTAQHDPTKVVRIRNQHAFVEQDEDGRWLLKLRAEIHREDWGRWQSEWATPGTPGGMSIAASTPILVPEGAVGFVIAGDAADFEDDELAELATTAPFDVAVRAERLYQFAADIEPVRMALGFVVSVMHGVPANLIADWLSRAMSRLRDRAASLGRPPAFEVTFHRDPDGAVDFESQYWLHDAEAAQAALETIMNKLEEIVRSLDSDRDDLTEQSRRCQPGGRQPTRRVEGQGLRRCRGRSRCGPSPDS